METMMVFNTLVTIGLLTISLITFSGCTTANYNLKPGVVENQKDTFKFKVFVGGLSGPDTADISVKNDLESYKINNGYKSYTILDRQYNFIPTYYEYTVKFNH